MWNQFSETLSIWRKIQTSKSCQILSSWLSISLFTFMTAVCLHFCINDHISGFDDYLRRLTPEQNERNLWFRDYWEDIFDCNVDQRSYYRETKGHKRRKLCNPKLRWAQFGNFMIFLSLRFYVKSIYGTLEVQNLPFLHI